MRCRRRERAEGRKRGARECGKSGRVPRGQRTAQQRRARRGGQMGLIAARGMVSGAYLRREPALVGERERGVRAHERGGEGVRGQAPLPFAHEVQRRVAVCAGAAHAKVLAADEAEAKAQHTDASELCRAFEWTRTRRAVRGRRKEVAPKQQAPQRQQPYACARARKQEPATARGNRGRAKAAGEVAHAYSC